MAATFALDHVEVGQQVRNFPQIRFMGSKYRLLPWIHETLLGLNFRTALDAFAGSCAVSYLLKAMGKEVVANDRLALSATIARAIIANSDERLSEVDLELLTRPNRDGRSFIESTFEGIFFTARDLRFLDRVWSNIDSLESGSKRSLALAALIRSCAKRQPRGVFTVAGDANRYDDGRRDLRLSIEEHFREHVQAYNEAVFDNGTHSSARCGDVFDDDLPVVDLVYMDPPYVPRSDDNCYVKRYHFLEGLATYWVGQEILPATRVKKIRKPFTPFSYRRTAVDAFDRMFSRFATSTLVLSYSSNGFPDLDALLALMGRYKNTVEVHTQEHRYHFGTHEGAKRNNVTEYLIVGR